MGICASCCREKAKTAPVVIEQPVENVEIVLATTAEVEKLLSGEIDSTAPGAMPEAATEEKKEDQVEEGTVEGERKPDELSAVISSTMPVSEEMTEQALPSAAETRRQGETGYALNFGPTNGGTLSARWVTKPTSSMIALARVTFEVDEIKLSDAPFDCGKNVKAEWMNEAKALCIYLRQCFQQKAEVELRPEFLSVLPRKAMIIAHRTDGKLVTIKAPGVLDFEENDIDGVAVLPLGADVYKGYSSQKLHQFLEKGVRKGATLRFQ